MYIYSHNDQDISNKFTIAHLKNLLEYFNDEDEIFIHDILSGLTYVATGFVTSIDNDNNKAILNITIDAKKGFIPGVKDIEGSTTIEKIS